MNQDKFEKKLAALLSDQTGHPEIVRDWYNFVKSFIAAESALASLVDHPRYRGDEREQTISKLLERIVPTNLLVQRGFVINSHLQTSQEQDILLIEGSKCTEIRSASSARYFPAESIC